MGKGIFEIFVCMVFFFFSIRKSVIMDSMSKEKKGKETENQIEEKRSQIKISVRNLVEFIFREGDIDNRHGQSVSPEAMLAGSRMHRRIQKRMGSDYHAEVPLKLVIGEENYDLVLEGRADGIQITSESEREIDYSSNFNSMTIEEDMKVVIDEIKGVYLKLEQLAEPVRVHKAQAMCYAYIFALQHGIEHIGIQMTYVNLDTEEIKYFHEDFAFSALEEWFDELIRAYKKWSDFQYAWRILRQESIQKLQFPFPYRKGQKELAAGVYRTIKRKKNLFIQAPTGVGKTISTVFPAVKAVGENLGDRIFYLTAKTITGTVAREAFELLRKGGYQAKIIQITAKEKLCMCDEMECNPVHCPYAKGHYDRVNNAVFQLLLQEDVFSREVLLEQAEKYQVCPFEMSLDVASWVDDIICDYNYVFDPNVALKRFFSDRSGDYLFLIDEAHNLVDRAREMYSAVMSMTELTHARHAVEDKAVDRRLVTYMDRSILAMSALRESSDQSCQLMGNIGSLIVYLTKLSEQLEETLKEGVTAPLREVLMEFYFDIRRFICAFDRSDDRYVIYALRSEDSFEIKIFCVDPSKDLGERLAKGCGAVFFSATLLPVQYYKEMLSDTAASDYDLYVDSPFAEENRLLVAATDVSSRYTRRGRKEYERMAAYIRDIIRGKHGNYMVFFPSYQLMKDVFEVFTEMELMKAGHGLQLVVQESEMSEDARQKFLDAFQADAADAVIGFCVMGGIFSEGIDLKEDRLIGVIIIGTGLPQVGEERELLSRYFNEKSGRGFEYAYLYPGMNKVLQAAGRVIRTEKDRGVIALLDERFNYSQYRKLFPREWHNCSKTSLNTIVQQVEDFWTDKA